MSAKIYDTTSQAFVDAETPKVNSGGVFIDAEGKVYSGGAWEDAWKNMPVPPVIDGLINDFEFIGNFNDECGNATAGTLTGTATYGTDQSVGNYVDLPNGVYWEGASTSYQFKGNTDFSISLWQKTYDLSNTVACMITQLGCSSAQNTWLAGIYEIYNISTTKDSLRGTIMSNPDANIEFIDIQNIIANTWHHLVVTHSPTSVSFYIDNALQGTKSLSSNNNGGDAIIFGALLGAGRVQYGGPMQIAKARIYNKVLSSSEISLLYNEAS